MRDKSSRSVWKTKQHRAESDASLVTTEHREISAQPQKLRGGQAADNYGGEGPSFWKLASETHFIFCCEHRAEFSNSDHEVSVPVWEVLEVLAVTS